MHKYICKLVQYCLYLVLSVVLDAFGSDMVVHN